MNDKKTLRTTVDVPTSDNERCKITRSQNENKIWLELFKGQFSIGVSIEKEHLFKALTILGECR